MTEENGNTSRGRQLARGFAKTMAVLALGTPLIAGVAWAGDGRFESWGSALIGFLFLVAVLMTSGTNGFWLGGK